MPKVIKPLIVIVLAVAVAAGAAVYLSRQPDATTTSSDQPQKVDLKSSGRYRGPENAKVTLVEFGDYQCPSCAAYHPFVKEILNRYPDQVRLEFRHFPLVSIHPNAMAAAIAAEAAGEQGRFWEMHDALFEYHPSWSTRPDPKPVFSALADQIGINGAILVQAMSSPALQQRVIADVEAGDRAKVQATPTFFINGELVSVKPSVEDFVRVIEARLNK